MVILPARNKDKKEIAVLDSHIPPDRLQACIRLGQVYVLKDDEMCNACRNERNKKSVVGVLRYSLFWQTIPFLDLLYLDEACRRQGFGTKMMSVWEQAMRQKGYHSVMTSTQADEDAWQFYEKIGYRRAGGFYPPEQEVEEWIYIKQISEK